MATSNVGGYEHEFLEPSAKLQEFECPLCLHVTREPHLTDCCGQHFCQVCINRIITDRKPCPFCKASNFNAFIDKKQKRKVLELKVKCPMKKRDCDWSGELGKLDTHVDRQNGSCQFVDVNCPNNCGESHQRRHLANHLSDLCPKRPFTCEYCKFEATYEHVCNDHYPKCVKYPVPCPNDCEFETVERGKLEQHLSECLLQVVECHLGCSERMKRARLPKHARECPKRPFTCEYCEFKATYEQVCNDHYPKCVKYPVPCPNDCVIETIKRGKLEQHLSECPLQVVECHLGCSERMKRARLQKHARECPKRPFTCKYCKFEATYEQVCNDHYPKCVKYPVPCPNNCEIERVEQGKLEQHVSECPLQEVECEFAHAGCSEKIKRKDLPKHMELSVQKHLVLVSSYCVKELDQRDRQLTEIQAKVVETKKDTATKLDQKDQQLTELQRELTETKEMLTQTETKLAEKDKQVEVLQGRVHELGVFPGLSPKEFTLANYSQYENKGTWVEGPVLCVAPKIQIKFYFTSLLWSQLNVELHQLPGESDDEVNWPVRGTLTTTLLNQSSDQQHISSSKDYVLSRPPWERHKYPDVLIVPHSTIKDCSEQDRRYLEDDNLKFRFHLQLK